MDEFVKIEVPGQGVVEFPSSMSDAEIEKAIQSNFEASPSAPDKEPSPSGYRNQREADRRGQSMQEMVGGMGESVAHGAKRFGAGVGQLISPAIDAMNPALERVTGQSTGDALKQYMQGQESSFQEKYGDSLPHKSAAFAAEMVPAFLGGSAIKAAQAPKFLMDMVKGAPALARGATAAGGIFGKNAALAGSYAPIGYDESFKNTGLMGGINKAGEAAPIGGAIGAGLAGLTRIPGLPSKALSMLGDRKAAQETIPQLEGLESSLGSAINSPFIKEIEEKILEKLPLTGAKSSIYRTGKKLEGEGIDILENMSPDYIKDGVKANVGAKILDTLQNHKAEISGIKTSKYNNVDALAEAAGVNIAPTNLLKVADEIRSKIYESSKEWGSSPKSDKNILASWIDSLNGISGGKMPNANFKKSEMGDAIQNASGNFAKSQLIRLRDALKKDIDEGMSGNIPKEVKAAYKDAEQYYAGTYAPLNTDKDLSKYLKDGADPDTLVNYFLKSGGKDDRSTLFDKLSSRIPAEDRNLIARQYFEQSFQGVGKEGLTQLSPKKMVSLYKNLPERTRNILLPEESFKKEMQKYITRVDKNPNSSEALFNEKTGAIAPYIYASGAILAAISSGDPNATAGILGTIGGIALTRKYLRSPKTREQYLKGLQPMAQPGGMASGLVGGSSVSGGMP